MKQVWGHYWGCLPQQGEQVTRLGAGWAGGQVKEPPAKAPGAECAGRQGFTGQGMRRAAWPVIPGHSAKSLGTTWPEAQTLKKQPGK